MSVDIDYAIYSKDNKFLKSFDTYNDALQFIKNHNVGYSWSYQPLFSNNTINCSLPIIVYIVNRIDTGGGYSFFSPKYYFNVNKLKGGK